MTYFLQEYRNILVFIIASFGLALVLLVAVYILSFTSKVDLEKSSAYECGFQPFSETSYPFEVEFALIAIMFLLFDIEVLYLFPLISSLFNLYSTDLLAITIFYFIVLIGLLFEITRKVLNFKKDVSHHTQSLFSFLFVSRSSFSIAWFCLSLGFCSLVMFLNCHAIESIVLFSSLPVISWIHNTKINVVMKKVDLTYCLSFVEVDQTKTSLHHIVLNEIFSTLCKQPVGNSNIVFDTILSENNYVQVKDLLLGLNTLFGSLKHLPGVKVIVVVHTTKDQMRFLDSIKTFFFHVLKYSEEQVHFMVLNLHAST